MEYITTKEASDKWGISRSRITLLANEGRIPGAKKLGKSWLIPAVATKPPIFKAHHKATAKIEVDDFSFPLYHFCPDFSDEKKSKLSNMQRKLLEAETAILECNFYDAYTILKDILKNPDDIVTEIGALGSAGICCIALNKPKDYLKINLRLKMLLSEDFPHRNDLTIILDLLGSYVETLDYTAKNFSYNTNINDQCLPLSCVMIGLANATGETLKPKSADTSLLEVNLRFLKSTGAVIAVEYMHCYLAGIYDLRGNRPDAKRHAEAAVKIAFENKFYFPLVPAYRFYAQIFAPIFEEYPTDFRNHCYKLISRYRENSTAFFLSINEYTISSKLNDSDFPYAYGAFLGLSKAQIAEKLGVHPQTVKRRLSKLCEEFGVENKQKLREYLRNYM